MILFLAGAVLHTLRSPRYDLVLVNTTPAIMQGATARLIKLLRGTPYIYNCQDLHPEAGLYGGKCVGPAPVIALLQIADAADGVDITLVAVQDE